MIFWQSLAGGVVGTLVLTIMIQAASETGITRLDLALLLGTTVTENRRRAKAVGYIFHSLIGVAFALAYTFFFEVVGLSSWWLGALLGALHGMFFSTVFVNVLLPMVHPRMATSETAANDFALLEPPGFLMRNYGRHTFLITLLAHVAYGAIVGAVVNT